MLSSGGQVRAGGERVGRAPCYHGRMYFQPRGGRVYRNPIIEAMRLAVTYGDAEDQGVEWPLPDYWPALPALDLWRLK